MAKPSGCSVGAPGRKPIRPGAVVVGAASDYITWTFDQPNPHHWRVFIQLIGHSNWIETENDGGSARSYQFDGARKAAYIYGANADGSRTTNNSNVATLPQ